MHTHILNGQIIEMWKGYIARQFHETSRRGNIIGAINGGHITIRRPVKHGLDYLNRKQYFSVLLQGIF